MNIKKFSLQFIAIAIFSIISSQPLFSQETDSLILYSPYTKIAVTPGKSVDYSIDFINKSKQVINENIVLSGIPKTWKYSLESGAYNVEKLAVLPNEKGVVKLKIDIPYNVRKGNYTFYIKAGNKATLPLTVAVSSEGSGDTEFTCNQKNMEGASNSSFKFNAVLKNQTPATQEYALMSRAPQGWTVIIKSSDMQATSTEVEANSTKNISYEIKAPTTVAAGTYKIPVRAISGTTSADMEFEVVITGTYNMEFSTPSGLISGQITAGAGKKISLSVKNTGSVALENVKISSSNPEKWEVTFDSDKIDKIMPGENKTISATIKANKKAIPGDYVVNFNAKTQELQQKMAYRVVVKTPALMGWLGILIILIAIGGVFYLFKKFGRR